MNNTQSLIEQFYSAFQLCDYRQMAKAYHPDATFHDGAFDLKNGKEIAAMWHMLCSTGRDLQVAYRDVQADEQRGSAHWDARYTFSRSGRPVLNRIDAAFEFQDDRIIRHVDTFSFWRWSRQALGPIGWLLGWTPFLQNKIRSTAAMNLRKFIKEHPEYK
ncbi:MAG: nuclear transport factor 2 family protein [Saprospiraceae bacterium]